MKKSLLLFCLSTILNSFANASSCPAQETRETLFYVRNLNSALREKIPICFSEQQQMLHQRNFPGNIHEISLRLFILKELLSAEDSYGIKTLMSSNDPDKEALLQEIINLQYHENPVQILKSIKPSAKCSPSDRICNLKNHIFEKVLDIKSVQQSLWMEISKASLTTVIEGKIPPQPENSPEGKDFTVVEKAHRIYTLRPSLEIFSSEEKIKILTYEQIYQQSISDFYAGSNSMTKKMRVFSAEMNTDEDVPIPDLDSVIKSQKFLDTRWKGGKNIALITSDSSMSPLKRLFGPGSSRIIYWPWTLDAPENDLQANLRFLRVSAMIDAQGLLKAVEIIARDFFSENLKNDKHTGWEPFVYEQRWGRWFPSQKIKDKVPVRDFCIRCHTTEAGDFSPRPDNVRSADLFEAIGYKNKSVIQEMMTY